jgi:hypothetical protein
VVTDNDGLTDTIFTTVTVANVAPVVGAFAGATLLPGESFTAAGTFTDPGADTWTATVDWGDGSPATTAALPGLTYSLAHTYTAAGTFTVTVQISDGSATAATSQTVTVIAAAQGVQNAIALVDQLVAAGKLSRILGMVLKVELTLAKVEIGRGHPAAAVVALQAVVVELDVLAQLGVLPAADAAPLRTLVVRLIASLSI